jgi:hypothetical protein
MAIRRCPYCKAIIDEEDKYCNNCGTQLLFPEDETIEEDIPGDKLIDDDREKEEGEEEFVEEELKETEFIEKEEAEEDKLGQEAEEPLPGEEGGGLIEEEEGEEFGREEEIKEAKPEEGEEEEIEEERLEEYREDTREDEEKLLEEEELTEEREDEGDFVTAGSETSAEETEAEETEISDAEQEAAGWPFEVESVEEGEEDLDKESAEEGEGPEEEVEEEEIEQPPSDRVAKGEQERKYEVSIERDELVFKTSDQDRLSGSAEKGKKEIDGLLSTYARKKPADEETPPAREESHPPSQTGEPAPETKEDLPPWASGIKEIPSSSLQEEKPEGEETVTPRGWTVDSGVGFPERLTQNTLPFSETSAPRVEEEPAEKEAEKPEAGQGPPALSSRLRAKLVDVLFITALWLISLWFTAQVIGVSFFRLIFGSLLPVLAFYLILLLLYFFLFIYFLGETLGDHYFSEED